MRSSTSASSADLSVSFFDDGDCYAVTVGVPFKMREPGAGEPVFVGDENPSVVGFLYTIEE